MKQSYSFATFGKQVGYVIAANVVITILGIVQVPIITRSLGTSLYGTWSLISAAIALIAPFSMLGFSMSIIRFLAAERDAVRIREDLYSALSLVFLAGSVLSLLFVIFSGLIANYIFKDPFASSYLRLASVLILLNSIFPVVLAYFRRGTKIGIYNLLNLSLNILQVGLIILLVLLGYQLSGVIIATIIAAIVINLGGIALILVQIGFKRPRFLNMKSYLKWGIPLTPNSAILWIIAASDRYIIGYLLGVSAAGIYSASYYLGIYASFALYPIGIVLYPNISRTYDEGKLDECKRYLEYSLKYLMMVSIPAAAGLSILAKPLLRVLTTPEFVAGSSVVPLVAFGAVLACLYQIGIYVIHLVGKTYLTIRLLGIAAVLNIILNVLLVPHLGIIGSGLASLISYGVLGILTFLVSDRYLKYNMNYIFMLKSFISSGIMCLTIWLIRPESLLMIFVSIVIGSVIYFGILTLIKGFTKSELAFFVSFFKNTFKTSHRPSNKF